MSAAKQFVSCSRLGRTFITGLKDKMQTQTSMENADVLKEVRSRYRICNYLFTTGAVWMGAGYAIAFLTKPGKGLNELWFVVVLIGAGIFSAAFALTLAIYRCPVCDQYLSRFRPDKRKCPRCGVQVRETLTGRP
jgi:hypothetical protein